MLVALLLQAAVADAAPFERDAWGRFDRAVALRHTREEVAVARDGRDPTTGVDHFRFRLVTRDSGGGSTTRWTTTRTCPAARVVVARFAAVPMPRPDPPAMKPGDIVLLMDGIGYSVTLPVGYGNGSIPDPATFRSNLGTPLSAWVEASFAALRPCWPDAPRF